MLQEKAQEIAEMGNLPREFKALNGRLQKFPNRHVVGFRPIFDESASVITATPDEWKHRLPTTVNGYNDDDGYNTDETALVFEAIPDRSVVLRREYCKGGKRANERYTILLCSN